MPVETLNAAEPVSIPATVYDKVWMEELVISAPDPNGDAVARLRLRLFTQDEEGVKTLHSQVKTIQRTGLLANEAEDADLSAAITTLMAYVGKVAVEEGFVAAPDPA